ncbi:peptide ABC transporter substrate-binding protein [Lacticaseibacillus sp. N501-2]|uniref:peptide ABC transporter substrate-binding protein n=1 Tax=Lacticaseibacillus salsurae TaxID=3367729 RepID=UPI0038B29BF2
MKMKKGMTAGAVLLASAALLAACGSKSSSSSDSKSDTWTRMVGDVIGTMDPSTNTDVIGGQQLVDTMEGLYRYNGSKLEPGLAKSVVEPTNNGKTYTFHLRKSTWSNGKAVTAKDFVYGWQRTVDPKTKSQYAYLFSGVKNADAIMAGKAKPSTLGVKAVDDYTLQVSLEKALPYFNTMMVNPVFFPQSKATVDKYGKKYGSQSKYILTNGPYTLKSWNGTGNTWTESKNNKFWDAKDVKLKNIKTQVVKDPSTANNLYKSGKLDDAVLSGEQAAVAKTNKDYVGLKESATFYMELNEKKVPAFKNQKIRQAISMAINRPQYIKNVLKDGSISAKTLTPQGLFTDPANAKTDFAKDAAKGEAGTYTDYNLAKAKTLFAQGMKEAGVSSVSVAMMCDDTDASKNTAEYLQNALEKLDGLKVSINSVPFKTRLANAASKNFDMVISGWSADFPDAISFLDLFTTGNSYNDGSWSNAQYDALIAKSKGADSTKPEARYNDLKQAEQILMKDQGVVPIYQRVSAHLTNPALKGVTYSPAGMYNYIGATLKR